jgi:hypothetical protein
VKLFGRWRIPGICVTPYCLSLRERGSKYPCCEHHGRYARSIDANVYADYLTDLEIVKADWMAVAAEPESGEALYWREYAKEMRESKERMRERRP